MISLVNILLLFSLLCVAGVLFVGIFGMIKGGEFNEKYGNKLMQARVVLQGVAILLLALSYFMSQY